MTLSLQKQSYPRMWCPHPYQSMVVNKLTYSNSALLLLDAGLGKTSITLQAISNLKKDGSIKKVLIVAPLRVCSLVWLTEVEKWVQFNDLKICFLHGRNKDIQLQNSDADIFLITTDGGDWLFRKSNFQDLGFDLLVIDEISKFKNTSSRRFKVLRPKLNTFKMRWGLTASPATNGFEGLFGQAFIVDLGASLGSNKTRFMSEFFSKNPFTRATTLLKGSEERIFERIASISTRMAISDYIDMPEMVEVDVVGRLTPDLAETYKKFKSDLFLGVNQHQILAVNAAVLSGKLKQFSNGRVYGERVSDVAIATQDIVPFHDIKLDLLEDLVESLQGSPLLLAYEYLSDRVALAERFGSRLEFFEESPKKQDVQLKRWENGEILILAGHPKSIGHGLNLQKGGCFNVAWISIPWDFELYDQFNRRVYRQGVDKSKPIMIHRIMLKGTIDEDIIASLKSKETMQNKLCDFVRNAMK